MVSSSLFAYKEEPSIITFIPRLPRRHTPFLHRPGCGYKDKALPHLQHFNFCKNLLSVSQRHGLERGLKLSICWLEADKRGGISCWFHGLQVRISCWSGWENWQLELWTTNQSLLVIQHQALRQRTTPLSQRHGTIQTQGVFYCAPDLFWIRNPQETLSNNIMVTTLQSPTSDTPPIEWYWHEIEMNKTCWANVASKSTSRRWGLQNTEVNLSIASNEATYFSSSPCANKRGTDKATGTCETGGSSFTKSLRY